jgi:hypothetical protein
VKLLLSILLLACFLMPNYYFLVGTVSFLAGVYIDQNYNVPNIKYWAKHAEEVVGNFILLLSTDYNH